MGAENPMLSAGSFEPSLPEFLWEERIPAGMFTLVGGLPGEGKSLLTEFLAAYVTTTLERDVIFSNPEDPPAQVTVPRLIAAGADLTRVHFWTPRLPRDTEELEANIREVNAALLVTDPVSAHLTTSIYSDDVRRTLEPVGEVMARTGCAWLGIHHTVRSRKTGDPREMFGGGNGGLIAVARAAYLFGTSPHDGDERVLAQAKFNIGAPPDAAVFEMDSEDWLDDDGRLIGTVGRLTLTDLKAKISAGAVARTAAGATVKKPPSKMASAAAFVTKYLRTGPQPVKKLREDAIQAGISWATLRRAEAEIGIEKKRDAKFQGAVNWSLPPNHPWAPHAKAVRDEMDLELEAMLLGKPSLADLAAWDNEGGATGREADDDR
jgi:putative DNA primase/helicase